MNEITHKEFQLKNFDNKFVFRVGKISPVELLAISQTVNLESFKANKELMTFCFENAEVKIGETWVPVKVKGREVYQPMGIEDKLIALNELFVWMLENVIYLAFTSSSESTEKTL